MKKTLLTFLFIMVTALTASADPFLVSDPQEGVEDHVFDCGVYNTITQAHTDGSFRWDFAEWTGGFGWYDCTVKARATYEVEDVATGVMTEATIESGPALVRIKIPKAGSNAGYRVSE